MIIVILCVVSVLFVISIGINIFLSKALTVQLKRIEKFEKEIDNYDEYVVRYQDELKNIYLNLKTIDDRSLFEKDDDVGSTFSEILRIVKELDDKINGTEEQTLDSNK